MKAVEKLLDLMILENLHQKEKNKQNFCKNLLRQLAMELREELEEILINNNNSNFELIEGDAKTLPLFLKK